MGEENSEKMVIIDSPLKGVDDYETAMNILYAKACVHDSLLKNELALSPDIFYAQDDVLDEEIRKEKSLRKKSKLAWQKRAEKIVLYVDRGISREMNKNLKIAKEDGKEIEYRNLQNYENFLERAEAVILLKSL